MTPFPGLESSAFRRFAVQPSLVEKPWGYEIIFASTERFCGKLLLVLAAEALNLHYHRRKDETLYLTDGLAELTIGGLAGPSAVAVLRRGGAVHLPPGTVHGLRALEESVFLEVSTPEPDDVVQLEDRNGRRRDVLPAYRCPVAPLPALRRGMRQPGPCTTR